MRSIRWIGAMAMRCVLPTLQAADPSAASRASAQASAQVIDGSAALVGAGSELTLAAVEIVADSAHLVLTGAQGSVTVSLKVTARTARVLAASVGAVIETVATRAGHLLIVGGEAVAFLLSPDASAHRHRRVWP